MNDDTSNARPSRDVFALAGLGFAVLAITVAVFQYSIQPELPHTDSGWTARLFGAAEEEPQGTRVVQLVYMSLGLFALVLGVLAFVRRENHRMAGAAVALGVVAIGWQYVLIALVIAVVIFLLSTLGVG